jgi:hypothetical protein
MSYLSIKEGHAIIAKAQKPHSMAIEKAIQAFALKGLAVPTLHFWQTIQINTIDSSSIDVIDPKRSNITIECAEYQILALRFNLNPKLLLLLRLSVGTCPPYISGRLEFWLSQI